MGLVFISSEKHPSKVSENNCTSLASLAKVKLGQKRPRTARAGQISSSSNDLSRQLCFVCPVVFCIVDKECF